MATITTLGKYRLHELIGKGGFGAVYHATDTTLEREVALKVLHPQLLVDDDFVQKFKKEAHILASIQHPNVVTIYEFSESDGRYYIAMRYLSGGSLEQLLRKEGKLSFQRTLTILTQVCHGLQAAHKNNLVHRDMKPANILFDDEGNAVISDFGLARVVQLSGVTSSTGIAGTPAYRAPEIWRTKPPANPASDVYSLGCILVEMLTGKILFNGSTPDEIITHHLIDGPKLPDVWPVDVPNGIIDVIKKSLSKERDARQKNADEFLQELENLTLPGETQLQKQTPVIRPKIANKKQSQEVSCEIARNVKMTFIQIPAGESWVGSDKSTDEFSEYDEQPMHKVSLEDYWISKYPITNDQYRIFIQSTNYTAPDDWSQRCYAPDRQDYPVVNVTWNDANMFCRWACNLLQRKVFLPTEAMWEKAARGDEGCVFPWGNTMPDEQKANYFPTKKGTTEVGKYPDGTSPYGVMDMAGNVWEWVSDWYDENYFMPGKINNPQGPANGKERVMKGGSWLSANYLIRSAIRGHCHPLNADFYIGFRIVML